MPGTTVPSPMPPPHPSPRLRLEAFFSRLIGRRTLVVSLFALLVPVAAVLAFRVRSDHSLDRMIVVSDPDVEATRAFQAIFPEPHGVLLLVEAPDPFSEEVLSRVDRLERDLGSIPKVTALSAPSIARRVKPDLTRGSDLARFLRGSRFFTHQGLVGDGFVGVALLIDTASTSERYATLDAVDEVVAAAEKDQPRLRIRRLGEPFVESWIERQTSRSTARMFPVLGAFVVVLCFWLFRSPRALAAILTTLGVAVLLGRALAAPLGYTETIVSALVPMTLMITATASLVYLHSRFIDRPAAIPVAQHQAFALANKFLPVTVSIFAAAVGFAALTVSVIRPIREMGIWTAGGLLLTWVACFTLFPALQSLLKTPTRVERRLHASDWFLRATEHLPRWTYRFRWPLVFGALAVSIAGAAALFGVPGLLPPMPLETDGLAYLPRHLALVEDARFFEQRVSGLSAASIWVTAPAGRIVEPEFLSALDTFTSRLEADSRVASASSLTSVLRLRRYAAGRGETFPAQGAEVEALAAELEQLLLSEPGLRTFVDVRSLASTKLTVLARKGGRAGFNEIPAAVQEAWERTVRERAALSGCAYRLVGRALLSEKIALHLVPTLVQSFLLTAGVIFVSFLLVFRSGAARLMAMVPSLFAILAMFLLMRLTGIPLNIATILIATTVLGATENDQVHFFYHFQEGRRTGSTEVALRHALRVAGSAIFFATIVNAGGFLALSGAELPPLRQFGILTSSAFLLSALADFTALPAALWIVFRQRPDEKR